MFGLQSQGVPKVIVMGSSTASETTINTSTDSSNTIVTTMTATDGDNTEDSLDLIEPLDILNTDNANDVLKHANPIQPTPITPKTPPTAKQQTPSATKDRETKFLFDLEPMHTMDNCNASNDPFDPPQQPKNQKHNFLNGKEEKNVDVYMDEQLEALKLEAKRRNSYKAAQKDFDTIDVVTENNVKHTASPKEKRSYHKREYENGKSDDSPDNGLSPKIRPRHKKSSRKHHHSPSKRDKFIYDEKHIAKYREKARMTPPLPDLRVDFFNETMDGCQQLDGLLVPTGIISCEKRGSVCLNKCLREVGVQLEQSATSPINVTTNPLENSVAYGGRKATIVVQQPSLSLDQQANVSTIVLKNGSDFVSNVESAQGNKLTLKKQKEENMKQLLDVANNLTLEEIHDFEMR